MDLSPELFQQVFALPPQERYELAQHLLDSIGESEAVDFDDAFVTDLRQRRAEMLQGNETVDNWRDSIAEIERALQRENRS